MKSNPSKHSIKEWLTRHNPFSLNVWEQGVVLGYTPPRLGYRTETKDRPVLIYHPESKVVQDYYIIPSLFTYRNSAVVISRGEHVFDVTGRYRKEELSQKAIYHLNLSNPRLSSSSSTNHWNPMAEVRFLTKHEVSDAILLSEALLSDISLYHPEKPTVVRLLAACILWTFYQEYQRKGKDAAIPTLASLYNLLSYMAGAPHNVFHEMASFPCFDADRLHYFHDFLYPESLPHQDLHFFRNYLDSVKPFECVADVLKEIEKQKEQGRYFNFQDDLSIDPDARDEYGNPLFLLLTHPFLRAVGESIQISDWKARDFFQLLLTAIEPFSNDPLRESTKVSDFQVEDTFKYDVTCYLSLPVHLSAAHKGLILAFLGFFQKKREEFYQKTGFSACDHELVAIEGIDDLPKIPFLNEALSTASMRGIQYYLTVSGSSASHSVDADRFVHQIGEAPNSFSGSRKEVSRPHYVDLRLRPYFQNAGYPQSTALSSGTVLQDFSQLFYYENLPEGFQQPRNPVQVKPEPKSEPSKPSKKHMPFVPLGFFDDFDEPDGPDAPDGSHPEPSRVPDDPASDRPILHEPSKPHLPRSRWDTLKSSSIDEPHDSPRFPEEFLGHPQLSDPPYAPMLKPEHPSKKEKE